MTRIWLNHWFSTSFNIINLIRQGIPDVWIIGTNKVIDSPIQTACDEWYREKELYGEAYIEHCLAFCREHQVDVFMPRRELVTVSKYKERFTEIGVKVLIDDYPILSLMNDKAATYAAFTEAGVGHVPEHYVVTNAADFLTAYETLAKKYQRVCFKFVKDEGGLSFHQIDNTLGGFSSLYKKSTTRITLEKTLALLGEKESFAPMIVMPYLPGEEISVDCLQTANGLIAIPRVKGATRIEKVVYDPEIISACEAILAKFPLKQPCNIQFKYLDGQAYLLEVNTRMSGGVQMSCAISGVNIPAIAVSQLLGVDLTWTNDRREGKVSFLETPVVL